MKFETEFKAKVYDVFKYHGTIKEVMSALENNSGTIFRYLIEDYLDEIKEQLKPRILLEDEHIIWNSQVNQYKRVLSIYSEFLEKYNQELEERKEKHIENQYHRR